MSDFERQLSASMQVLAEARGGSESSPRLRWSTPGAALLIAAVIGGVFAIPALVDSRQSDRPPASQVVPTATEVDDAAESVGAATHQLAGYGGTEVDHEHGRVILYWKGDPPGEAIAATRSIDDGVSVRIEEVPYSLDELMRAADRATEFGERRAQTPRQRAGIVRFLPGMKGIEIVTEDPSAWSQADVESYVGVPVVVVKGSGPRRADY